MRQALARSKYKAHYFTGPGRKTAQVVEFKRNHIGGKLSAEFQRVIKKLEGDGPVEKHILLVKLSESLQQAPDFGDKPIFEVNTPQRRWLASVSALLSRLGIGHQTKFRASFSTLASYWKPAVNQIQGQVLDAIEELKLELELDGRSEFGSAYAPGDVYRFFADLKNIVNSANSVLMVIDPFFDGTAFDAYLSPVPSGISVRVLVDRYANDVAKYVDKHRLQYKSSIELRSSKALHDRIVLVDDDAAWIMGGSIKDAGKKATYLIPLGSQIAAAKKAIYADIWTHAAKVE